uniref:Uncharacterized protein n=1 Tax=Alexandrium catenella TaxID=2925 RepID=A0A7S1LS09_ALECA
MKAFCSEPRRCRQHMLVEWLAGGAGSPEAVLGNSMEPTRCGVCDNCKRAASGMETERDMIDLALPILQAMAALGGGKAEGFILDLLMGTNEKKIGWALRGRADLHGAWKAGAQPGMGVPRTRDVAKAMVQMLRQEGYLSASTESFTTGSGYNAGFQAFDITPKGKAVLQPGARPELILPIPQAVRDEETKAREKLERKLAELRSEKISLENIPAEELRRGTGPIIDGESRWVRKLDSLRKGTETQVKMAAALEALLARARDWRQAEAVKRSMAPGAIADDPMLRRIVLAAKDAVHSPDAEKVCFDAGMRFEGTGGLAALITAWREEYGITADASTEGAAGVQELLTFPANWQPRPVAGAPKLSPTVTESLDLFSQGHDLAAVAIKKAKQVVASTVENHLSTGLLNADPRVVRNLARIRSLFPNRGEVEKIQAALRKTGSDAADPKMTLGPVALELGGEEGKGQWYGKLRWFCALVQLEMPIAFEPDPSVPGAAAGQKRGISDVDAPVGLPTPQRARPLTIGFM